MKKKVVRKVLSTVLVATMVFSLTACGNSTATETPATTEEVAKETPTENVEEAPSEVTKPTSSGETLIVGTMANALGLPVHVAQEKGYFEEAGLDVQIEIFATGAPINEAMAAGNIDVAVSGMASVYGLATGMYTYVGDGVITSGGESIYARADSKFAAAPENDRGIIGSAEVVKGASILGPLATTAHYQAIKYAEQFGLTTEDFSMVSMDYAQAYQAFVTGEGDLIAAKMPYTNQLEDAGYVKVCDMNQVLDDPIVDTIFVQNAVAADKKADVELFLDCYYKACADIIGDEAYRRETAMTWYAEEGINYSESDMNSEVSVKNYYTLAEVDTTSEIGAFMINIGNFFVDQEMISQDDIGNVGDSIDHSFIKDVKAWSSK